MGTYIKDTWNRFSGLVREAITLFAIATAIAIIFLIVAELFCEEDGFCDNIMKKLSEAFTFIAAASLTGAVYVLMSEYKEKARTVGLPKQEFMINGDTYELQQFYVKK